jgi:hypothetical protein
MLVGTWQTTARSDWLIEMTVSGEANGVHGSGIRLIAMSEITFSVSGTDARLHWDLANGEQSDWDVVLVDANHLVLTAARAVPTYSLERK